MKSNDQIRLEEAYSKVILKSQSEQVDEKVNWKGALAGAAIGLGAVTGAHAGDHKMNADDYADKEMIQYVNNPEPSYTINPADAFDRAIELIHANKIVPESIIKTISKNSDLTKRCARLMVLKGLKLPDTFKKIVGDYEKEIKSSIVGP